MQHRDIFAQCLQRLRVECRQYRAGFDVHQMHERVRRWMAQASRAPGVQAPAPQVQQLYGPARLLNWERDTIRRYLKDCGERVVGGQSKKAYRLREFLCAPLLDDQGEPLRIDGKMTGEHRWYPRRHLPLYVTRYLVLTDRPARSQSQLRVTTYLGPGIPLMEAIGPHATFGDVEERVLEAM